MGEADTLEALFRESADAQTEVTVKLGRQVRSAVELLTDSIGRADRERNGELLKGIAPGEIYSGVDTVLMRLVYMLVRRSEDYSHYQIACMQTAMRCLVCESSLGNRLAGEWRYWRDERLLGIACWHCFGLCMME